MSQNLIGWNTSHKSALAGAHGIRNGIMYLIPDRSWACRNATPECLAACLRFAGRGQMTCVETARRRKADRWKHREAETRIQLYRELDSANRRAERLGQETAVRLDGLSDLGLPWFLGGRDPEEWSHLRFVDYTKDFARMREYLWKRSTGRWFNYSLTFSFSGRNEEEARAILENGGNVAVVFRDRIPARFWGRLVVNGDAHDLRYYDDPGCVVGLLAKGRAKRIESSFIVEA